MIYVSARNNDEAQTKLQEDLLSLFKWFDSKDLVINMKKGKKTECMLFGTIQKIKNKTLEITSNQQHRVHTATNISILEFYWIKLYPCVNILIESTKRQLVACIC